MDLSKDIHPLDMWDAASRMDWIPYLLDSLRYMIDLYQERSRRDFSLESTRTNHWMRARDCATMIRIAA